MSPMLINYVKFENVKFKVEYDIASKMNLNNLKIADSDLDFFKILFKGTVRVISSDPPANIAMPNSQRYP